MYAYKLTMLFIFIRGMSLCNIGICLSWSVNKKILELNCKVDKLHYKVKFVNQYHKTLGYCLQPFPASHCFAYYSNSSVTQNASTNVTSLIVRGSINNKINGQWSCLHGTNLDVAVVNVTVLRHVSDKVTKYSAAGYTCLLWTNVPFIITLFLCRKILWLMEYKQERPVFELWFPVFCSLAFITKLCTENYSPLVLLLLKCISLLVCSIFVIVVPLYFGSIDEQGNCTGSSKIVMPMIGVITGVITIWLLIAKEKYSKSTNPTTLTQQTITTDEEHEYIGLPNCSLCIEAGVSTSMFIQRMTLSWSCHLMRHTQHIK